MGSAPKATTSDPEADAQKAADKATVEANTKKAQRRSSTNSVLGSQTDTATTQKSTLGGG